MKILVTGSTGLIGKPLVRFLKESGHTVAIMVRSHDLLNDSAALWDPQNDIVDIPKLDWIARDEGFGAVINLAGENLSSGRWTPEKKLLLRDSRIKSTKMLCEAVSKLKIKPKVLINASAVGFYSNRGDEILNEDSEPGKGFLADLCVEWEKATSAASDAGIRVIKTRFGIILSTRGGALGKMLIPFRIGMGGPFGEGTQFWSWIALGDVVRAIYHCLLDPNIIGPVCIVSPTPVTNMDFSLSLGYMLHKPGHFHIPDFLLRMVVGEMADEMLLSSARVMPVKLKMTGFNYQYPILESALKHLLEMHV